MQTNNHAKLAKLKNEHTQKNKKTHTKQTITSNSLRITFSQKLMVSLGHFNFRISLISCCHVKSIRH